MTEKYSKRIADRLLADRLEGAGAVLVEGAKWCGKTTTCEQVAKSVLYMGDPDSKKKNLQLAEINVKQLLEGASPRLIDEWQEFPRFWDAVRFQVDHRAGFGHFILTGSSVPPDTSEISHSGTGRISRMTMRPMTLWESGDSNEYCHQCWKPELYKNNRNKLYVYGYRFKEIRDRGNDISRWQR